MDDNSIMPFGTHKGKKLANIPASYLFWLYNEGINPKYHELEDYIEDNLDTIKTEVNKNKYYNKE